mgnify:CR=1 FL=1
MRVEKGLMVPLGYGKFFRSEKIVGLEPVEEGRGPGQRTRVYIEALPNAVTASRSAGAILGDMIKMPKEVTKSREPYLLRSIMRDQRTWDLDTLEEQICEVSSDVEE